MAFKLVRSAGSVHEPAVISLPGSGVIKPNSVVIFDTATVYAGASNVSAASTSLATGSAIIGVSLDYIQGINEPTSFVRVIPFVPGQLWEADVLDLITTAQVLKRHRLYDSVTVENTSYDQSEVIQGVFFCLAISGASTGSAKLIGEFLRTPKAPRLNTEEFQ